MNIMLILIGLVIRLTSLDIGIGGQKGLVSPLFKDTGKVHLFV